MGKKKDQMTNEEFLKDFEEFQNNWQQENDDWMAEASTIISFTESPAPKKKATRAMNSNISEASPQKESKQQQKRPESSKQYKYMAKPIQDPNVLKHQKKKLEVEEAQGLSNTEPGPQSYKIKHDAIEIQPKGGSAAFGITREKFLEKQKKQNDKLVTKSIGQAIESIKNKSIAPLPKYDYVRPNYHKGGSIPLKGPVQKKRLDAIKAKREELEKKNHEDKMTRLKVEKMEQSKGIKKQKFTIAPIENSILSDKQLQRLVRHILQKNPSLMNHKVYEQNLNPSYKLVENKVTGPKITETKVEVRNAGMKEMYKLLEPGPNTYSQDDRILHPSLRNQAFGKDTSLRDYEKSPEVDWRKPLYPNIDAVKPTAPVMKMGNPHLMTDSEIEKLYDKFCGPQSYNPDYKITEKRNDIGVVNIKKQNATAKEDTTDERPNLYPNSKAILPNHMTFKYFQPYENLGPTHQPESQKNPGQWKYYDVNLDAVKEVLGQNVYLAGGLQKDEFAERQDYLDVLTTYLARRTRVPEAGEYEPTKPEKHLPDIDFDKYQSRSKFYEDDLDELDQEGDVLILDPRLPEEHKPNIDFSKAFGRGEDFDDLVEKKDEMILAPNYDAIRPNVMAGGIAMDKQVGRPVEMSIEDDEVFVLPTGTDAIPNDPMKPKVIAPTFDKQGVRFKYQEEPEGIEQDIEGDVIKLNPERKLPKEKVLIRMDKAVGRYDNVKKESNIDLTDVALDDGEFKGIDLVDINKAFKANLPHLPVADFKCYQSTAKYRVDLPPEAEGEPGQKDDDN